MRYVIRIPWTMNRRARPVHDAALDTRVHGAAHTMLLFADGGLMSFPAALTIVLVACIGMGCSNSPEFDTLDAEPESVEDSALALSPAQDGVVPGSPRLPYSFYRRGPHIGDLNGYLDELRRRAARNEKPCLLVLVPLTNPTTGETQRVPMILCS